MSTDKQYDYDVVIVGAGITGSILANQLGREGFRVLVLDVGEKNYFDPSSMAYGGKDPRQPLLDSFFSITARVPNGPYPQLDYAPMALENNLEAYYTWASGNEEKFKSTGTRMVGGTTQHWLGTSLRFMPNSFASSTHYGIGADWPLTYDDLEAWYSKAEWEIGVSGDDNQHLGSPRRKGYPMPQILPSYMDQRIAARIAGATFEGMPLEVRSTPAARNSVPFQDRPPCTGAANCIPICPVQAKYDATVHLKRALSPKLDPEIARHPEARPVELRHRAVVTRVHAKTEGDGAGSRVSQIEYLDGESGQKHYVTARMYVLAAHAIENAKILLMSPWGDQGMTVANSSDAVGRYLMDHDIKMAYGLVDEPLYPFRGPKSTSGIESLRDGPFRKERAGFRLEIQAVSAEWGLNTPFSNLRTALNGNSIGDELYERIAWDVNRTMQIGALVEAVPLATNTIRPSKTAFSKFDIPKPEIRYSISDYTKKGGDAFGRLATQIFRAMGSKDGEFFIRKDFEGAGHIMGTHRMGHSRRDSVTNSYGQTWDHDNLWLTGSGLFPTVDSANPTLTIVALTLRQAAKMIDILKTNPS